MAVDTKGQLIIWSCDCCDAEREMSGTFKDCWEALKSDGWRCFKEDGEWRHKCDECVGSR